MARKRDHWCIRHSAQVLNVITPWGLMRHLKVWRDDGKDGISWDILQEIKDELLGQDAMAVEVYPPQDQLVNETNMRHLWEVPADLFPFILKKH